MTEVETLKKIIELQDYIIKMLSDKNRNYDPNSFIIQPPYPNTDFITRHFPGQSGFAPISKSNHIIKEF